MDEWLSGHPEIATFVIFGILGLGLISLLCLAIFGDGSEGDKEP